MAYGRGVYRYLECLTCGTEFRRLIWRWDDPDDPRNSVVQNDCPNANCPQAHIRIKPSSNVTTVQVRESQRAAIYRYPDGTWAAPGSNDPNDPVAQAAIREGAVRQEFYHIRDMHDLQRELRKNGNDEFTGRNDVIDFDESSLRQRDYESMDIAALHRRESLLRDAFESIGGAGNAGRYERALRELEKRRR